MLARAGIAKSLKRPWTQHENAIIRRHYPTRGAKALVKMLPRRNFDTIKKQAIKLGVKWTGRTMWSARDERLLEWYWINNHTLAWIADKLGRSPRRVHRHAEKMGLLGIPHGYESLTAAARRTCYADARSLRRVLKWAGVRVHALRACTRPGAPAPRTRRHYVDPDEVNEAIARWHARPEEAVAVAARNRGIPNMTLHQWLVDEGAIEPSPSRVRQWVDPAVIDQVVGARITSKKQDQVA